MTDILLTLIMSSLSSSLYPTIEVYFTQKRKLLRSSWIPL